MTGSPTLVLSALKRTPGPPHSRNRLSVDGIALLYLMASMPCLFLGIWHAGRQWAGGDASVLEALTSGILLVGPRMIGLLGLGFVLSQLYGRIRNRPSDLGWLVVSWFFLLLLPPAVDLLPAMLALAFGLVFVLFVFGGLQMAPFHATLAALIFLDVAFGDPGQLMQVAPDSFQSSNWYAMVNGVPGTGLDLEVLSFQTGSLGVMSPALVLLAGLFLLLSGVASHRVMVAGLAGAIVTTLLLDSPAAGLQVPSSWLAHLLLGNFLFVLIFLASDPSCQPLTRPVRWVAGFAFGVLTVLLRVLDPAHPESSLMALLLVSLCVPVVDAAVVRWFVWRRSQRHDA